MPNPESRFSGASAIMARADHGRPIGRGERKVARVVRCGLIQARNEKPRLSTGLGKENTAELSKDPAAIRGYARPVRRVNRARSPTPSRPHPQRIEPLPSSQPVNVNHDVRCYKCNPAPALPAASAPNTPGMGRLFIQGRPGPAHGRSSMCKLCRMGLYCA